MKPSIGGEYVDSKSEKFNTTYDPPRQSDCSGAPVHEGGGRAGHCLRESGVSGLENTPVRKRASIMMKLRSLIERDMEELTRLCATVSGKCWNEAAGDVV